MPYPLDPARKTPSSLFGPLLSQFFLLPVSSYENPSPLSFCLYTHTHTHTQPPSPGNAHSSRAQPLHVQTLPPDPQLCSRIPTPRSKAPRGLQSPLLPFLPCVFPGKGPRAGIILPRDLPFKFYLLKCPDPTTQKVSLWAQWPLLCLLPTAGRSVLGRFLMMCSWSGADSLSFSELEGLLTCLQIRGQFACPLGGGQRICPSPPLLTASLRCRFEMLPSGGTSQEGGVP